MSKLQENYDKHKQRYIQEKKRKWIPLWIKSRIELEIIYDNSIKNGIKPIHPLPTLEECKPNKKEKLGYNHHYYYNKILSEHKELTEENKFYLRKVFFRDKKYHENYINPRT